MSTQQLDAFSTLQQRWLRHQQLRATGASIAVLFASRKQLDDARLAVRRA